MMLINAIRTRLPKSSDEWEILIARITFLLGAIKELIEKCSHIFRG